MDSAARNFLALTGIAVVLVAEALCGLAAYVLIPLLGGSAPLNLARLFPTLMLAGLVVVSAWLGVSALRRNLSASQLLAERIQTLARPLPPELLASAQAAGLAGRVDLVDVEAGFSFVYGFFRPRVAISRGLGRRLSAAELRAALEHERYHVLNRDPLRSLIATVLVDALFLLPSLVVLQRHYEAGRELAADRGAEERCGRRSLIGALLKALEGPRWSEIAASAPLGSPDLLSMRLARIETGQAPRLSAGGPLSLAWSIFGIAIATGFFAAAIISVSGPPALGEALSAQLSPAGAAYDALCVAPVLALTFAASIANGRWAS
jgi:Zn-dependent protease with chaperone function